MATKNQTTKTEEQEKKKPSKGHIAMTVLGIILCILIIPILVVNITLSIKSYTDEDSIPSIFGYMPFIVQSGSMEPTIMTGDIIVTKAISQEEVQNLKVGDIISYYDKKLGTDKVTTHAIVSIDVEKKMVATQGTLENATIEAIDFEDIIGVYTGIRIPYAGDLAMFMSTTTGLIVCVAVPLVLFVLYDVLRRYLYNKKKNKDKEDIMRQIEEARARKEEKQRELEERENTVLVSSKPETVTYEQPVEDDDDEEYEEIIVRRKKKKVIVIEEDEDIPEGYEVVEEKPVQPVKKTTTKVKAETSGATAKKATAPKKTDADGATVKKTTAKKKTEADGATVKKTTAKKTVEE